MKKYACSRQLRVETQNESIKIIVEDYINNKTDIAELVANLTDDHIYDRVIYGYSPWNYVEEIRLDMKYQGFLK